MINKLTSDISIEMMKKRISVRKYKNEELNQILLDDILQYCKTAKKYDGQTNSFEFEIVEGVKGLKESSNKTIAGFINVDSPYYLVIKVGSETSDVLINAGYVGEDIILMLTSLGIGTCWYGTSKTRFKEDSFDYIIAVAFGIPFSESSRKPLGYNINKIYEGEVEDDLIEALEMAKIAPTALNVQLWKLKLRKYGFDVYKCKAPLVKKPFLGDLDKVNLGILMFHYSTALENQDIKVKWYKNESIDRKCIISGDYNTIK